MLRELVSRISVTPILLASLLLTTLVLSTPIQSLAASPDDSAITPTRPDEIEALQRAFRGFVAVAFPTGGTAGCRVTESTQYQKKARSFFRSWFEVSIEIQCAGQPPAAGTIWFLCSEQNQLACELINPP